MEYLSINPEWYRILNSNYLLIHKNGCTSVRRNFSNVKITKPDPEHINWTVIRNPLERFKSGLAYDIQFTQYVNTSELYDKIENLVYGNHNYMCIQQTNISHTYMQSLYFLNEKIHLFVRIEDLEDFVKVHNNEYLNDAENKNKEEAVKIASEIIDRMDKQRLNDLFYIENQIYNKIINSSYIWRWQNGKVIT